MSEEALITSRSSPVVSYVESYYGMRYTRFAFSVVMRTSSSGSIPRSRAISRIIPGTTQRHWGHVWTVRFKDHAFHRNVLHHFLQFPGIFKGDDTSDTDVHPKLHEALRHFD